MTEKMDVTPSSTDEVDVTPASTDKRDMALDDIVKDMKKPRRGGGRGRGGRGNNRGKGSKGPQSLSASGIHKLLISNLNFEVSDTDINELFSEVGKIKEAIVHYNSAGKSLGTAHVIFAKQKHAVKAMEKYNDVHLDGRPMRISREGEVIFGSGQKGNVKRLGKGQGGGRRDRNQAKAEPKTAEELDAELDAYTNSKGAANKPEETEAEK